MNKDLLSSKFDSLDQYYLGRWDRETEEWSNLGMYDKVADMLDLKRGDVHVDFGSGNGELLSILNRLYPRATLIGVERSKLLLALSGSRLRSNGVDTKQIFTESLHANGEGVAEKDFIDPYEQLGEMNLMRTGGVTLIQDDIRSLKILKKVLGNQKIDSATFMFPGASESMAFESPYTLQGLDFFTSKIKAYSNIKVSEFCNRADLDRAKGEVESCKREIDRRLSKIMNETRMAMYQRLSELVKPQGQLVITERTDPNIMASENQTQEVRMNVMGEYGRYWEPESPDILLGVTKRKFGASCIDSLHGVEKLSETEQRAVVIQRFIREQRGFVKPTVMAFLSKMNII